MRCVADAETIEVGVWMLRSQVAFHADEQKERERPDANTTIGPPSPAWQTGDDAHFTAGNNSLS
jgi:hypothetical protein